MTWPLVLSSYPRPILRNNLPLMVLAIVEKGGLVTEASLAKQAAIGENELQGVLFDLRLDNLLEYGSHHVRLTERGKGVISRFELDIDVASSILDVLQMEGEHRESFARSIQAYRDSAYKLYLNSLCSAWTWHDLAHNTFQKRASSFSREIVAGMRTLVARDLDHWWKRVRMQNETPLFSARVREGCAFVSDTLRIWEASDDELGVFARLSRALEEPWRELPRISISDDAPQESPVPVVFLSFVKFRSASEPDLWFDRWHQLRISLPQRRRRQRLLSYTRELQNFLSTYTKTPDVRSPESWFAPTNYSSILEGSSDEFLAQLLTADSLSELAEVANLPRDPLRDLLRSLLEKCQRLLDTEDETSNS